MLRLRIVASEPPDARLHISPLLRSVDFTFPHFAARQQRPPERGRVLPGGLA